jgi:hypothetical protein
MLNVDARQDLLSRFGQSRAPEVPDVRVQVEACLQQLPTVYVSQHLF